MPMIGSQYCEQQSPPTWQGLSSAPQAGGGTRAVGGVGGDGVEHMGPLAVIEHIRPEQQVPVLQKVPRLRQEAVGGPDRLATGGGVAPPVPMPMPVPVPLGAHVIMPMGSAVHCPEQQSEA